MNNDMHETVRLPRGAERDQLFLKLHKQGLNLCEIEWKTGWGMEAVRKALHRQGVSWPRRADAKKPGPKPSDATVDALCNACGNVRTAKAAYLSLSSGHRPLRCDVATVPPSTFGRRQSSSRTGAKASTPSRTRRVRRFGLSPSTAINTGTTRGPTRGSATRTGDSRSNRSTTMRPRSSRIEGSSCSLTPITTVGTRSSPWRM